MYDYKSPSVSSSQYSVILYWHGLLDISFIEIYNILIM
jgi:hypothetical protein